MQSKGCSGCQARARGAGGATRTSLFKCSFTRYRSRGPSMSSTRPFSRALVQHPLANHDVVTRIPRPARFSSIAPTSSRIWLTPITPLYFLAWTIVRPPIMGSGLSHNRIDTVISGALGRPSFQSACFEQLPHEVLKLRRCHLGEIRSGIEAGDYVDAFDE